MRELNCKPVMQDLRRPYWLYTGNEDICSVMGTKEQEAVGEKQKAILLSSAACFSPLVLWA
ncbi:MAG: hypothetical protein H0U54_09380 [Acidobacteria bacterium]|nr:hypothetical protein [Acidobacteriota bacterium]